MFPNRVSPYPKTGTASFPAKLQRFCYHKILFFLFSALPIILLFNEKISGREAEPKASRNILIFNSSQQSDRQSHGITNFLKYSFKKKDRNIGIFIENLDFHLYNKEKYFSLLPEFLLKKYSDRKFELILTVGNESLDFLLRQNKDFFPGVPAVFCGTDIEPEFIRISNRKITGITGKSSPSEMIQLISRLQPSVANIILLYDSSSIFGIAGRYHAYPVKSITGNIRNADTDITASGKILGKKIFMLNNPSVDIIRQEISNLKSSSAIVLLNSIDDNSPYWTGVFDPGISASIPFYALWKYPLSKSIIGGLNLIPEKEWLTAVNIAMQIMHGKDPGSIPFIERKNNRYLFDARMLEKFSIDPSLIPAGSIITNKEYPALFFVKPITILLYSSIVFLIIIIILLINIYKRKTVEKTLRTSEERFKSIYENSMMGIYRTTPEGRVIMANPALVRLLGYSSFEELTTRNLEAEGYRSGFERQEFKRRLEQYGSLKDYESAWRKKEGELVYIRENASVVKDTKNNIIYYEGVIEDITDRKMTEEQLRRYIEELQLNKDLMEDNAKEFAELNARLSESEDRLREINSNKDKFFSIISHDLRSPFNSLIGFSDLLVNNFEDFKPAEVKNIIGNIHNSIMNIYKLIENLLQWSGIQTGKIRHNPQMLDLRELAGSVIHLLEGNAVKKEITIINKIGENSQVYSDEVMLHSVIQNLLSNAIKFTNPGGTVKLQSKVSEDMVEVTISDNGTGMSQDKLEQLFRLDSNTSTLGTKGERGTGLGLIICRELVEKNGGKIRVESIPSQGTDFVFTLPTIPDYESVATDE